ncbi:deoxyuridine 5'-triphosphate nucleotidohydrolase [Bacillus manliponensis]|uniref:dUTP diphosphatase n=1 Tax=Bacillus manliponensis TaxID=574376 RepID=A0A073JS55_9BACI|nr:dUTP diphosphatase [Bacillus manliponensis]KEK17150.1 deoxyuridine 5'-triphosphate nucleotidohydrolase [Bacillus manliponensis]
MRLRVKVKRINEDVQLPRYAREGDAGFDLVTVEDIVIWPGETKIVPTGLAFEIPPGYEMQVRPRSGISRKKKLHVILGTIDSGYRGEVGVIVENITRPFSLNVAADVIEKGTRIAQGIIAPVETARFEEVDELSESQRGASGFGSTDVKS